ncbi:MAG: hypothetical protein ACJ72Z_10970 [Pyrinomonadaceae bacterium]
MTKEPLEKWMRYALFVTGPVNFLGALIFMPPFASLRSQFTLPEPHPFYLWIISIWIFAFGCCYLYMAITERRDRIFIAIGAIGKLSFSGLLIGYAAAGTVPATTAFSGLLDIILGIVFVVWLVTTRDEKSSIR